MSTVILNFERSDGTTYPVEMILSWGQDGLRLMRKDRVLIDGKHWIHFKDCPRHIKKSILRQTWLAQNVAQNG